jgi:hypothetical protein
MTPDIQEASDAPHPGPGIAVQQMGEWRHCDEARFNRAIDRADRFQDLGAEDLIVWYDEREDYVIVEFMLDGHHYRVRSYRIHAVVKDGNTDFCHTLRFDQEYALFRLFESGKHKVWGTPEEARGSRPHPRMTRAQ